MELLEEIKRYTIVSVYTHLLPNWLLFLTQLLTTGNQSVSHFHSPRTARIACIKTNNKYKTIVKPASHRHTHTHAHKHTLTDSVRQYLQANHPLVAVQLQAVYAVKAVIFDQVKRGVDRNLVQHRPLPLGGFTWCRVQNVLLELYLLTCQSGKIYRPSNCFNM